MKQTVLVKLNTTNWEGAQFSGGRIQRSLVGKTLDEVILNGIASLLTTEFSNGTTVMLDIRTETAEEVAQAESLQSASEAEQMASSELQKLESVKTTRTKIRALQEELKKEPHHA